MDLPAIWATSYLSACLPADFLVMDDNGLFAAASDRTFKKVEVEAVLAWVVKALAPLFLRLVLINFVMVSDGNCASIRCHEHVHTA